MSKHMDKYEVCPSQVKKRFYVDFDFVHADIHNMGSYFLIKKKKSDVIGVVDYKLTVI